MMNELRAIAKNMHEQRPEWDLPGILTILARLDLTADHIDGHRDPLRIRAAAQRVAQDPNAKTPAAIAFSRYWRPPAPELGPLPECAHCRTPRRRDATPTRCSNCHRPWREVTP